LLLLFSVLKKVSANWYFFAQGLTTADKVTNQLLSPFSPKMAERCEAKSAKLSFPSNVPNFYFSLRSAIFSENKEDNQPVTLPAGVK